MIKQGEFFLCQPDEEKSCGACCGLYNFIDHSREFITNILKERRETLLKWKGTLSDYRYFMEKKEKPYLLFPTTYTCPFLTFLNEENTKIGCVLHPLYSGQDRRDVAYYGSKICSEHRCVSYLYYSEVEWKAVVKFTHDWYLYGMVLHDIDFVKSFFRLIEEKISRKITSHDLELLKVREAFEEYFSLKEKWPFKIKGGKVLDKYESHENEYRIRRLNTWGIVDEKSHYYKIFRSLESEFSSSEQLENAIKIFDKLINKIRIAIESSVGEKVGIL